MTFCRIFILILYSKQLQTSIEQSWRNERSWNWIWITMWGIWFTGDIVRMQSVRIRRKNVWCLKKSIMLWILIISLSEIGPLAMVKPSLKALLFKYFTCSINSLLQHSSLLHSLLHPSHHPHSLHLFMFTWGRPHQCCWCHQCRQCSCRAPDSTHHCTCLHHHICHPISHSISHPISIHMLLHLLHNILCIIQCILLIHPHLSYLWILLWSLLCSLCTCLHSGLSHMRRKAALSAVTAQGPWSFYISI